MGPSDVWVVPGCIGPCQLRAQMVLGPCFLVLGSHPPPFTCFTPNTCSLFGRQPLTPLQMCQECLGVSSWGRCWPAIDWTMKMNVQLPRLKGRNTDIIYTLELSIGSGRGKLNLASISCISPPSTICFPFKSTNHISKYLPLKDFLLGNWICDVS